MAEDYKQEAARNSGPAVAPHEVKILFNGLFFFSFPDATQGAPFKREFCTAGILSTRQGANKDHSLFIRFKQGGPVSEPIEIPHSALSKLSEEIVITKDPPPTAHEVTIRGFEGKSGWAPRSADDRKDRTITPDYFNWIIDFEDLHPENLTETPGSLRPKLKLRIGDFFTKLVSEDQYTIQQGEGPKNLFGYVAATMGAKIVLTDTERLVLIVNGVPNPLPMNISEIHLNNVRPEHMEALLEDERSAAQQDRFRGDSSHPQHSHGASPGVLFEDDTQIYYYDLLQGVGPLERFHFEPVKVKSNAPTLVNPPFICFGSGGSR